MTPRERYAEKLKVFGAAPCCPVPLMLPNPTCDWHGYRSLLVALSDVDLPDTVLEQVLTVETQAQVHALVYVRKTLVATAQEETATGHDPLAVITTLVRDLNALIAALEK